MDLEFLHQLFLPNNVGQLLFRVSTMQELSGGMFDFVATGPLVKVINQHFALMNLDDAGQIIVLRMNFKKIFVLILGMARMNRDVIIAARTMHRCWKRSQALAALAFGLVNMAMSICGSKQGMIVGYIWADVHIRLGGWLGYRVTWTMVLLCVACVETAHSCANDHGSDAQHGSFMFIHSCIYGSRLGFECQKCIVIKIWIHTIVTSKHGFSTL